MRAFRIRFVFALAFAAFVAIAWLNQGVGGADWEAFQVRALGPSRSVIDVLRYPSMFLYRRSTDEALYYATASATLGRPYEVDVRATRGDSPLPALGSPEDGRFHVPYAEVPLEYPPPNLPFILLPRLVTRTFATYAVVFGALMGALLLVAAILGARLGSRASYAEASSNGDQAERMFAFGLLLLLHGAIAIQRLDAVVALLLVLMVRAAVRRDDVGLGLWGGLVGATKFVPILVLPVLVVASGVRGWKRLVGVAMGTMAGLLLGLGPMVALGRESLPLLVSYHSARGLHVESTLGVLYGAIHALFGAREAALLDYGSYNFHGSIADVLAKAALPVTFVLLGVVTCVYRPASDSEVDDSVRVTRGARIVLAALAAVTALWLGGKVFSPQYLTWALPLVVAIPGRASFRRASLALGLVLLVSQIYLRGFYDHVYNQWPLGILTMVVRLVLLAAYSRILFSSRSRRSKIHMSQARLA